ncbi:MAG TPA: HAMP domain-containing sensor histidine kinase [Streptosporangiaceae bacterium]|jgi:two-component system OmpR family sensor kinase|nr:HAMP domain-containing sensor histidine kinase [Streptosporangiaceae bacterium]
MTHPAPARSFWRSARQLPSRTPLRVKLIAAVLVLVTAALAVISIAGIAFLRGYLLNQADQELSAAAHGGNIPLYVEGYLGTGRVQQSNGGISVQWLPPRGSVRQVAGEFRFTGYGQTGQMVPGPEVRRGASWLATVPETVSDPVTVSSQSGQQRWRVISTPWFTSSGVSKGTIILGIDVTNIYRTLNELTIIDLIISCALLLVLAAVGVAMIRSSMRPLRDIERTAEAIAAGDLGLRVPERDPRTEVGRLGRSLNAMLAHIELAFRARTASEEAARRSEEAARRSALDASRSEKRMRQFVADASHELRTPLTAIRGFAEYYRQRGGVVTSSAEVIGRAADEASAASASATPDSAEASVDRAAAASANRPVTPGSSNGLDSGTVGLSDGPLSRAELDRLIQRVEGEAVRMGVLVDDMLLLARLDQQRSLDFRTVDLLAIAADALHDARVIAPKRTINLTVLATDAPLVSGDEVGLRQVVGNLMSNAMMHTPEGTPIELTIRSGAMDDRRGPDAAESRATPPGQGVREQAGEPAVILEVSDHGLGLTKDQQEHVFERFYRTDRARSRTAGGTGLGLAIVAAMIGAHNGKVWVDSEPGQGATFGFALPLAPEARPAPTNAAAE